MRAQEGLRPCLWTRAYPGHAPSRVFPCCRSRAARTRARVKGARASSQEQHLIYEIVRKNDADNVESRGPPTTRPLTAARARTHAQRHGELFFPPERRQPISARLGGAREPAPCSLRVLRVAAGTFCLLHSWRRNTAAPPRRRPSARPFTAASKQTNKQTDRRAARGTPPHTLASSRKVMSDKHALHSCLRPAKKKSWIYAAAGRGER